MKIALRNTLKACLLMAAFVPGIALAGPISYDIGNGSSGGFSASWLHAATGAHSGGFYMNGDKASIEGEITIDWSTGAASGSLFTDESDTDFGEGSGSAAGWILDITGGTTTGGTFANGADLLIALDYSLSHADGSNTTTGTFYFADHPFAGDANSASPSEIYLWGNNWFNDGTTPKPSTYALGIDLYGTGTPVPEPGILLLLGSGLLGMGLLRKQRRT